MSNHPFENPKPEHVWKHRSVGGTSTLVGSRKHQMGSQINALKTHAGTLQSMAQTKEALLDHQYNNRYVPLPPSQTTMGCTTVFVLLHCF